VVSALDAEFKKAVEIWSDIALAIKSSNRVLLWGPPGTGKSYIGTTQTSREVFRLYLTLDTPGSEIRGHYLPSETGGFSWHDGPATRAWRMGGRLVIDEIDAASGDTLTLLLGYLDDHKSAKLTLPTNEQIKPHGDFSCVATTNQLPTTLPEALLDRFEVVLQAPLPNPAAFTHGLWHSEQLLEAAKRTVYVPSNPPPKGRGGRPIGLRNFNAMDRLVSRGLDIKDAARLVVGQDAGNALISAMKIAKAA